MKMMLAGIALAGMVVALTAWAGGELARGEDVAEDTVSIGVDADPTGNTATSLGPIDSCVSLSTGDTIKVDLFVTDVTDLLAWETYFVYDMSVINIVSTDVMMFQAANSGSNVFDVSEGLPDIDGQYGVAAVDIAEPPAPDSGSGVLARLTLKAVGAGVSPASLSPIDVNGDGTMDLGPWLKDLEGELMSDLNGDGFFDGPIANAQIAVDAACPESTPASPTAHAASPSPTPTISPTAERPGGSPTPDKTPPLSQTVTLTPPAATRTPGSPTATETEGTPWTGGLAIMGYVAGGLAVVLLGGAALLAIRRRRAR
jgi:hypothetical protein